jgi:peroxiredoxin
MLEAGVKAPFFELHDLDGHAFALDVANASLYLAIFFKTTCPTCQYAWPFYERLHQAYAGAGLRVVGISQHDAVKTREYRATYEATFPHLLDEGFAVSRAYDPEFVPTALLIDRQGAIVETLVGWQSQRVNELSEQIARRLDVPAQTIVQPQDHAVAFKAG